jgi:predicted membrane channel-forming protein YqfA (hemolysin III family)
MENSMEPIGWLITLTMLALGTIGVLAVWVAKKLDRQNAAKKY